MRWTKWTAKSVQIGAESRVLGGIDTVNNTGSERTRKRRARRGQETGRCARSSFETFKASRLQMGNTPREPKVGPKTRPTGMSRLVVGLARFGTRSENYNDTDHRSKNDATSLLEDAKTEKRRYEQDDNAVGTSKDAGGAVQRVRLGMHHSVLASAMRSLVP